MAEPTMSANERCTWCGTSVDPGDGYRLLEQPGARRAVFCRLEHVPPWALRGAHWEPRPAAVDASPTGEPGGDDLGEEEAGGAALACAECGADLGEVRVLLVRHRGAHRIADPFCSVDHAREWATAGGRYR